MNQIAKDWKDYEVIDTGNKEKLERWNHIILRRPDPVCIWPIEDEKAWKKADAIYHRSNKGGGYWEYKKECKEFWTIAYKGLRFKISPLSTLVYPQNKPQTGILLCIPSNNPNAKMFAS